MVRVFVKRAFGVLVILLLVFAGVVWLGRYVTDIGEEKSRWIRSDFWSGSYFNISKGRLSEIEVTSLKVLDERWVKDQGVINYLGRVKCRDHNEFCALTMVSMANLLIGSGEGDSGLKLLEEVRRAGVGQCPINFELSILNYKAHALASLGLRAARAESGAVLEKIKRQGGLIYDLRNKSCNELVEEKPELFHQYAVLLSKVMMYAGDDDAKAAAYIQSVNKLFF